MAKVKYNYTRVYGDVLRLIGLLKTIDKSTISIKIEGLESLETELKKKINTQNWTLQSKLIFRQVNKKDLKIPNKIETNIKEILLELKVVITELPYSENEIKDSILQNERTKYGVQIVVYGKTSESPSYKMSWHLDKHIRSQNDERGKGFAHPEYHFNMGGFALTKEENFDFGQILLIDTPRLIHPPLDIVLSIDFVLKNFYGIRVKNLTDSNQYKTIISNAKERLWRPFYIALASHWESPRFNDLDIEVNYINNILG